MKLSYLLENMDYTLLQGDLDADVEFLTSDSRKAKAKTAFVCIVGAVSDGHKYIGDVINAGASVVVVQEKKSEGGGAISRAVFEAAGRAIPEAIDGIPSDVTVISVKNTRYALAVMSAAYFGHPAKELFTIGITGTKGKTTTTYMIRNVLEACKIKTGLIGTIEIIIGDKHIHADRTTPESYEIQQYFRQMADSGCRAVVMEVSSQGLKLDRTAGILFDIGVFTNLESDHIGPNEHESFEDYLSCKAMLFKQCRIGIVNDDDAHTPQIIKDCTCTVERYGIGENAGLRAENIQLLHKPGKIGLTYDCKGLVDMKVELNSPGKFSVYNSLCAIAVTRHFNVDKEILAKTLKEVKVKGRIELVKVSQKFSLMIDYAHNAMALESILATLKEYNPHRLVCLFGCGGNRAKERRYEMGEVSGKLADFTIITSDNPRFEEPEAIIEDIKTGINKTGGKYIDITDRKEAIKYAIKNGEPGDIIILAGKGHEDYQEIKGVKYPMDERVLIAQVLDELKAEGWKG